MYWFCESFTCTNNIAFLPLENLYSFYDVAVVISLACEEAKEAELGATTTKKITAFEASRAWPVFLPLRSGRLFADYDFSDNQVLKLWEYYWLSDLNVTVCNWLKNRLKPLNIC